MVTMEPPWGTYTVSVTAKVLLAGKSLATHWARIWPLSCVAADVPLHDSLLLSSVRAERALVQFHRHDQPIACMGRRYSVKVLMESIKS